MVWLYQEKISFIRNGLEVVNEVSDDNIVVSYFNSNGNAKGKIITSAIVVYHELACNKLLTKVLIVSFHFQLL